jgi:hypothetical protein
MKRNYKRNERRRRTEEKREMRYYFYPSNYEVMNCLMWAETGYVVQVPVMASPNECLQFSYANAGLEYSLS